MKRRLNTLDGLRFFMILTTTLCHTSTKIISLKAAVGVDFFFILSGFTMMYRTYLDEKYEQMMLSTKGMVNCYSLARKQHKRLIFWYLIAIFISLPLQYYNLLQWHDNLYAIAGTLLTVIITPTLLQSIFAIKQLSHLGLDQCWFISTLFVIYVIFPYLLRFIKKISKHSIYMRIAVSLLCIMVFENILLFVANNTIFNDLQYGSPYIKVLYFILGMIICQFWMEKKCFVKNLTKYINVIEIIITIILLLYTTAFFNIDNDIFNRIFRIILCVCVIYFFSLEEGIISRFLSSEKVVILGGCSMYIYLFHYTGIHVSNILINSKECGSLNNLVAILLTIAFTAGAYIYDKKRKR